MKLGFFHDAPLIKNSAGEIYSIGFPYNIWKRYLTTFETLVISTRMNYQQNIDNGYLNRLSRSDGDNVEFFPITSYNNWSDLIMNYRTIQLQIAEAVDKVDCVIARLPSVIGILACKEAIRTKKEWAVEVVGCAWDSMWNLNSLVGKLTALPLFAINKSIIKKSRHAIYVTEEFLQKRYPSFGTTSSASNVEIKKPEDIVLKNRIEKINSIDARNEIVLGLIGSLNVNYKGHETAIRMIALLRNQMKCKIKFLGSGTTGKWMGLVKELELQDIVEFDGVLPSGNPVLEWLDGIDVYIQPSKQEGLPRATIEAMSRGCPVIATNVGGLPELIESECIVEKKDIKKMVDLIQKMVENKEWMLENAIRNFEKAKEYDSEIIKTKRTEFLQSYRDSLA